MKAQIRFRPCDWFDPTTLKVKYGIQAHMNYRGWMHCIYNGSVVFFHTEAARNNRIMKLRKEAKGQI